MKLPTSTSLWCKTLALLSFFCLGHTTQQAVE